MGLFIHRASVKIAGILFNFCVTDLVGHWCLILSAYASVFENGDSLLLLRIIYSKVRGASDESSEMSGLFAKLEVYTGPQLLLSDIRSDNSS